MTETTSAEAVQRELGGCPVMHRDFAPTQAAGCHWQLAARAPREQPHVLQHLRAGLLGLHAPRRREGHVQARRDLLERVDHAVGAEPDLPVRADADRRAGPHQVPPDPQPVVLARGRSTTPSRGCASLCRELVEAVAPTGGCDFVDGVRAAVSHRGVPERDRRRPADADLFARGSRTSSAASAATRPGSSRWPRRSTASASTGSPRSRSAAASRSPARATSRRTSCTRPSTSAPSPMPRCSTC